MAFGTPAVAGADPPTAVTVGPQSDALQGSVSDDRSIESVQYGGIGVVRHVDNTTYLFAEEPHRIDVTFTTANRTDDARICLDASSIEEAADDEADERERGCVPPFAVENGTSQTETIELSGWMGNWTGESNVTVSLVDPQRNDEIVDEVTLSVHVLERDEDLSGSGLTNAEELRYGTNFARSDTVGNGLLDSEEVLTFGTDPLVRDTSGNGISDGFEVLLGTDPLNPWTPTVLLIAFASVVGGVVSGITLLVTGRDERIGRNADSSGATAVGGGAAGSNRPTDTIVTDQERVLELLYEHDGRMKQHRIVAETEWSKSKVSRLLSRMEEDGHVSKIRLGRENIVSTGERSDRPGSALESEHADDRRGPRNTDDRQEPRNADDRQGEREE